MLHRKRLPSPWRFACLAALLGAGCEFGPEAGRNAAVRLWHCPGRADSPPLPSDTVSLALAGDSLELYRRWNGCHHLLTTSHANEFHQADSVSSEVLPGPAGDSLRFRLVRDTGEEALTLAEIRADCVSGKPMASIEILSSDFDSGVFGRDDSLRLVLRYRYVPQAGYPLKYYANLNFFTSPSEFVAKGGADTLEAAQGTARIAVAARDMPLAWREGKPIGYMTGIAFVRNPNLSDYISDRRYRPIRATFRGDP